MLKPAFLTSVLLLAASSAALAIEPRVIGGDDVPSAADAPFVAGLVNPSNDLVFCTGSLITPNWVMTAAHCLTNGVDTLAPGDVTVFVNTVDKSTGLSNQRTVDGVYTHPDYNDDTLSSDIALLHLASPASGIGTASVADSAAYTRMLNDAPRNDSLLLYGWGFIDDSNTDTDTLQRVRLDFLAASQCNIYYNINITSNFYICAWEPQPDAADPDGEDSCQGDSGGPLISDPDGNPWVVGMTSFGPTGGCGLIDGQPFPSVYSNLANFNAWLEQASRAFQALVDIRPTLAQRSIVMSASATAPVDLMLSNSTSNNISTHQLEITGSSNFTLVQSGTSLVCLGTSPAINCTGTAIAANSSVNARFNLNWTGGTSDLKTLTFTSSTSNDMRVANNVQQLTVAISDLPDLALTLPGSVSGAFSGTATGTLENRSVDVAATDATLNLNADVGINITAVRLGGESKTCSGIGTNSVSCSLGTLNGSSSAALAIDLDGGGKGSLSATVSSPLGDYDSASNSATASVDLVAQLLSSGGGGGGGGGLNWQWSILLLLYGCLRRKVSLSH